MSTCWPRNFQAVGTLAAGFNLEMDLDEFYPEFVNAIREHLKRVEAGEMN